jgi:signal transduction histidine kinase
MWIAAKLASALVGAIAVVLVLHAVLHYRRVSRLYESEMRDDLEILAHVLGDATSEIWSSAGAERATDYVRAADEQRTQTRITLHRGAAPSDAAERHATDRELVAYVPLKLSASEPAFLELRRSTERAAQYRQGVIESQVLATAVLVLVSAGVSLLLGMWLIGRPVQRLIDQTRRVGSGDFDALIELGQRDELGKLADELGRMTRQLSAARSQLVTQRRARASLQEQLRHADRLSTVGKVASGIAHELGTPLNVVAGRAAIIGARASDDDVVNNAEIIGQQARRMTEIIRELLDFSRRRGVQRQDVRVADVIHQATTLLEPIAEEKGVDIVVEPMAALRAEIDVNKLLQVLTNLMTNAVQAMPDGGTLTIRAEERDVREPRNDHAEPGAYVAVTVVDQGQGIAEEDLEHIFQPFFTTKRVGRGTGLGLYVCHGIVREQAGWIDVTSKQGEGSSFTVFLPQHGTPRSER